MVPLWLVQKVRLFWAVYLWLVLPRAKSQKPFPTPLQCQLTTADDACCLLNALGGAWALLQARCWSLRTTSPSPANV